MSPTVLASPDPHTDGAADGSKADGSGGGADGEPAVPTVTAWGPWVHASVDGEYLRLQDGERTLFKWEHCMDIEVDVLPVYCYPPDAQLRYLRHGSWCRFVVRERVATNTYAPAAHTVHAFFAAVVHSSHRGACMVLCGPGMRASSMASSRRR
jgi:hypothetical protein